jgi:NOL1/NOP2/fmu family ribosome biogenesis protein
MQGNFLNRKEIKHILHQLEEQWGFTQDLDYAFFMNNQRRVALVNKEFALVADAKLRLNSLGLYFCELMENGEVRLSIEGSQLVGPYATKNVVDVDFLTAKCWMYGEDLPLSLGDVTAFVILKHGDYFLGCGRYKNGVVSNHVSKNRRIGTLE